MYGGQFWIGLAWLTASVALLLLGISRVHEAAGIIGFLSLRAIVLIDSYLGLRRQNQASDVATAWALILILIGSQAWLLVPLINWTIVETYKIPASSMEPTLLGNVGDYHSKESCPFAAYHQVPWGDRIIVSKLAYVGSPIRRFEVAVFRFPLNQSKRFVKRVVGLPEEELMLHAGDLFVRPKSGSVFEIVRKPMDVQDRIWIRMSDDPEVRGPIDDSQGNPVADVRVSFEVQADAAAAVFARIVNRHGTFKLEFPKGQPGRLRHFSEGKELKVFPLEAGMLMPGRWHAVELMFFDGQVAARLDSKILGPFPVVTSLDEAKGLSESPTNVSWSGRQDGLSVRGVRVDRDIHYRGRDNREFGLREDEGLKIPPGQYVCFGDNVANSHDSRAWVKRTFVLKDGRKVVCEAQQVNEAYSRFNRVLQDRLALPEPPLYAIDGDQQGNEVAIVESELLREEPAEAFRFVDRRFFVGRVVKIWWPLVREGPVR